MSKAAEDIEEARRIYVRSMGTDREALARAYLEELVRRAKSRFGERQR